MPGKKRPRITSFQIANGDADELSEHYARALAKVAIEPFAHERITAEDRHYNVGSFSIWSGACHSGMQVKVLEPPDGFVVARTGPEL